MKKIAFSVVVLSLAVLASPPIVPVREAVIRVNPITPLHKTSKDGIFALRKSKIDDYNFLYIYPKSYVPDFASFSGIDGRADWIDDAQFFIVNPYLLVLTSSGNYVNALLPYCSVDSVSFRRGQIEARYQGEAAEKWLAYVFDHYPGSGGTVRLWFINAQDAGYKYAHVDPARSENIGPDPGAARNSIVEAIYRAHDFIHFGSRGKNNISPNDSRAKLTVKRKDVRTVIHVKLWRQRPSIVTAPEDFAYIITVEP